MYWQVFIHSFHGEMNHYNMFLNKHLVVLNICDLHNDSLENEMNISFKHENLLLDVFGSVKA